VRVDEVARVDPQPVAAIPPDRNSTAFFWPRASADLVDYVFFPKGKDDHFWAYGFGAILNGALAAADSDDGHALRKRAGNDSTGKDGDAASRAPAPGQTAAVGPCGGVAADSADGLIERIAQAIRPSESQRDVMEQLRSALTRAIERISSVCPGAAPATPVERLQAIQDRIWAMRDALLTLRLPLEKFYDSLSDEQHWRLSRDEADTSATGAKIGREQSCGEQAALMAEAPMRTIERAVRPTEQQRASLEALRLRSAGMAQLIMSSCPTYPLLGHMGRFSAALDRLDGMLFAVMTLGPTLQGFYDSLTDKQKTGLAAAVRQLRRSAAAGSGS
jgi:hypothetical protein